MNISEGGETHMDTQIKKEEEAKKPMEVKVEVKSEEKKVDTSSKDTK